MSEYYMKMKDLIARLKVDGYSITGRMIKHYIDIGILQKPYYVCSNQALYADFHYIRLKRILSEKKAGNSIAKIKDEIFKENEELVVKAGEKGLDSSDIVDIFKMFGFVEKEEAKLARQERTENKTYSKVEILEKLDSDGSILDLAVDTGVLQDKDEYDSYELYILTCVKNLIKVKKQNKKVSGQLIERISEISKLNSIANELAYLINSDKDNSWLYTYLLEAILFSKTERESEEEKKISVKEENDYKYKQALAALESMEKDKNFEG
ncbi:hypothetical protein [Anaerofustis sp.]|uniref:hypothetical protein n=1 Tax=Anaerofustis sp. TaxID=1872517 RepID=UPI0025C63108|nr:hypothetical protein [Anaerofustis sp.]